MTDALDRMTRSLEGLSCGDAFGQLHFHPKPWLRESLPPGPWPWTDDTEMACVLVAHLREHGEVRQDELAAEFARWHDRERGYGPAMVFDLLPRIAAGEHWSAAASALFDGKGSFGNGAAMRVAPLGAFFAEDPDRAAEQAALSAEVTHAHPEAVAGAVAVAVTVCLLHDESVKGPRSLIERLLPRLPDSQVRGTIELIRNEFTKKSPVLDVAARVGNGDRITAMDTVPLCVWAAASFRDDYEGAVRAVVSAGGDMDTTAAIVGGIVGAKDGAVVPQEWRQRREPLPRWAGDPSSPASPVP